ncbi:MAG TPA: hypothetical protein VGP93_14105, partial [Polyangiaceae bacterium]|nr:hypothetical protein [Polyangiaceae bacterium]
MLELDHCLFLVTAAGQRQPEVAQRRRKDAMIARRGFDHLAKFIGSAIVFATRQKLAAQLCTHEKRALGASDDLALVLFG